MFMFYVYEIWTICFCPVVVNSQKCQKIHMRRRMDKVWFLFEFSTQNQNLNEMYRKRKSGFA